MISDDSTLIPFAKEHSAAVRRMVLDPSGPLICPACAAELTLGPPVRFDGHHVRELRCGGCGRGTMIRDRG